MREEILNIMENGGEYRINEIVTLVGTKKKKDVELKIYLDQVAGVKGGKVCEIRNREYSEVIKDISSAIANYLVDCALAINNELMESVEGIGNNDN